jgi:hypothetical protein
MHFLLSAVQGQALDAVVEVKVKAWLFLTLGPWLAASMSSLCPHGVVPLSVSLCPPLLRTQSCWIRATP